MQPQYTQQNDPYAPPVAEVYSPTYGDGGKKPLAGRGTRLVAQIVDGVAALVAAIPAIIGVVTTQDKETLQLSTMGNVLVGVTGIAMLGLLIYNLMLIAKEGQTLGKKMMNIRVVRSDGSRAGFGRVFGIRMFVNGIITAIPLLGSLYALVDVLCIFKQDRRCIHDLMADTKVVVG
jgi:uncharacterized RDD family membrane protein YckC